MIADVTAFFACDYAADRVPLPGGLVHEHASDQVKPTTHLDALRVHDGHTANVGAS
ncbi:hypothetical protein [Streptomyces sp. NPDC058695]|uniref:hypothetical protein n=1 Tax=Streptomyces sp. NPDC058695 TaxID=3346604 RepID=UPI00365513FC